MQREQEERARDPSSKRETTVPGEDQEFEGQGKIQNGSEKEGFRERKRASRERELQASFSGNADGWVRRKPVTLSLIHI